MGCDPFPTIRKDHFFKHVPAGTHLVCFLFMEADNDFVAHYEELEANTMGKYFDKIMVHFVLS